MSTMLAPHTAELLDLAAEPTEKLAEVITEIRDLESKLREAKSMLTYAILERLDRDRLWTVEAGGLKIKGTSDAPVAVWDVEKLQETLDELVAEGAITADAKLRALEPCVEFKVRAAGITALVKSPDIAERIDACRDMVAPSDRRVSISRRT